MTAPRVGIVGVGQMGLPFAERLLAAGLEVHGHRRGSLDAFAAHGGHPARSPREAAERSDVVLVILPPGAHEDAVLGRDGVVAGARRGVVVAEMSTVSPALKERIGEAVRARGAHVADCPVVGQPSMVRDGRATVFASGDTAALDACVPVLEIIAGTVHRVGAFGQGTRLKLVSQLLLAVHHAAAAEALALAERVGLDPAEAARMLAGGPSSSAAFDRRGPLMAARTYEPAIGPIGLLARAVEEAGSLAADVGASTPLLSAAAGSFARAEAAGLGDRDLAALFAVLSGEAPAPAG